MVDQLTGLRHDIEEVMAPWRTKPSSEKPPFEVKHLVVMALVMSDEELSIEDVVEWITRALPYYAKALVRAHLNRNDFEYLITWEESEDKAQKLVREVECAAYLFDLPLTNVQPHTSAYHEIMWRITSFSEARLSLQPVLQTVYKAQSVSFFDLPAEFREHVYNIVFAFPRTGLWSYPPNAQMFRNAATSFNLSSRSWSEAFSFVSGMEQEELDMPPFQTQPMEEILRPLLISRQFYNEAMPNFYRNNLAIDCDAGHHRRPRR